MKDKALKQALEALEEVHRTGDTQVFDMYYAEPAIAAIKEALAETDSEEIETLVYMAGLRDGKKMEREKPTHSNLEEILNRAGFYRRREWEGLTDDFCYIEGSREAERISIPPKREWVGLTDDEFDSIDPKLSLFQFHKAIEAKLKEKNNG